MTRNLNVESIQPRQPAQRMPGAKNIKDAPMKVMVVDGNHEAANSLGMVVRALGHEVRTAFDGEEALRVGSAFHPKVVLLELSMPRMDGYEACRRMRLQPWGANMTVVAVTGSGQTAVRSKAALASFDLHFLKPVAPELIASLLEERATA